MEAIKTNWKKIIISVILIAVIVLGITVIILKLPEKSGEPKNEKSQQQQIYAVSVQVRDQHNSDPEEDARTCLKKGDVLVVLPEGHTWSKTELISSLILKIKMTEEQAAKLTQPIEKESGEKRENGEPAEKETVKMRKYRIKIEDLDFDMKKLSEGQPFGNKVFEWKDIVEEK
ncbi:hypothetical protein J7J13_03790 [bacterium]|nr:hypothetical protein [bacterium]